MSANPDWPGVQLSPPEVAWLIATESRARGERAVIAVALVLRESGGMTNNWRPARLNPLGGNDRGLFMFNDKAHPGITDRNAYDPIAATQWFDSMSSGGAELGPWDMGPDAYSGDDKLPDLKASRHWAPAVAAVANPVNAAAKVAPFRFGTGAVAPPTTSTGASASSSPYTAGEDALLAKWDDDRDGKLSKADITDHDNELADRLPESQARAIADAVQKHKQGGTMTTGWLADAKRSVGATVDMALNATAEAQLKRVFINVSVSTSDRGWFTIPIPGGGINVPTNADTAGALIDAAQGAIGGAVGALVPDWAAGLTKFLGALTNPTFWKAVGVGALGLGLIYAAVALSNRDAIIPAIATAAGGPVAGAAAAGK